jgi:hypothetical protein
MGEMVHPAGNEAFANLGASASAKTTVVLGSRRPAPDEKSAFTGWRGVALAATTIVSGGAGLRRLKKALLPGRRRRAGAKRQPGWGGNGKTPLPL